MPAGYHVELVLADENKIIEKVERADRLDVVFADLLGTGKIPNYSQGIMVMPASGRWKARPSPSGSSPASRATIGGSPPVA